VWRLALLFVFVVVACGGEDKQDPDVDEVAAMIEEQLDANQAELPGDAASEAPVEHASLAAFIREYQRLGFFAGDTADDLVRAYERDFEERPEPPTTRLDELELLGYDRDRAWFSDIELDVLDGNDVYVTTLAEWARLSRGAFEPRDVEERWQGEDGPVTISFALDGREHTIEAAPQGDFLDLCVLPAINALIDGRQLELYRPDAALGQVAFVVALTAKEKRALEEHGWTFATPADIRNTFGYGQLYEAGEPTPCET
jgi:hypothetical protein